MTIIDQGLLDEIEARVLERIEPRLDRIERILRAAEKPSTLGRPLVSKTELQRWANVNSSGAWDSLRASPGFPKPVRVGSRDKYRPEEIEAWATNQAGSAVS